MKTVEQALLGLGAALALHMATSAAHAQPAPPVSPAPVVDYEYDAEGRPTKATLAKGVSGFGFTASKAYDGLGRLKSATDAKAGKTEFGYDALDRTASIKDPRSLVTQYPRNGLGDVRQLISPDTGTASHTYDPAGNLLTRTDSRGVLSTYTYDALNRLRSVVRSKSGSPSLTYSWTYDQTGAGFSNGIGRLTSAAHPAGSAQYAYDPHGRLITDTQVVTAATGANAANVSTVVRYEYDGGRLSGIVYPSGRKLVLAYDGAGQLSGLSLAANTTAIAVPLISQLQYEPFGGVRGWQWHMATGTQAHTRVFDNHGRLVRYSLGGYLRDITYDAASRITAYTHYQGATPASSLNQSFGYDQLGRLTGITTASASWSIGYDANGNRTGVTMNGVASSYTTSPTSNRLTAVSNPAVSFGHDAAGNTTAGQFTATYNLAGRMATLAKGGVTTTYSVDGQGRRVRKFNSAGAASTIIFVYSKSGQLLGEYDSTGKPLREYVWLGSKPLAVFTPAGSPLNYAAAPAVYYIHADHIDTPRIVLDQNNGVRWRWLAEPFGTTAAETNPANLGAFTFNLRFPGQYFDQESGLHYNHHRDYDSSIGRYVESDPVGLRGGVNTYAYVDGDPIQFVDPNGLVKWTGHVAFFDLNFGLKIFRRFPRLPVISLTKINLVVESECIDGMKLKVELGGFTGGHEAWANLSFGIYFAPVELEDGAPRPMSGILAGGFSMRFKGMLFGWGDIRAGQGSGSIKGGGFFAGEYDMSGFLREDSVLEVPCVCP